jgi:hypothetical protein
MLRAEKMEHTYRAPCKRHVEGRSGVVEMRGSGHGDQALKKLGVLRFFGGVCELCCVGVPAANKANNQQPIE